MKKFMVLYMMPVAEMDKTMKEMKPEDMKKGMDEWMTWANSHPEIVDIGNPLGKNTRITKDSASLVRNEIGAYSFVEAESVEAAAEVLKGSPHFQMPGAYVEVMEIVAM